MPLFSLLFSFQGRIGRLQWWGGGLVQLIVGVGLFAALTPLLSNNGHPVPRADFAQNAIIALGFSVLGAIVLFWMGLALNVKRLHDRGKSGVWLFINLVPIVGPIWFIVELAFFAGDDFTNSFGPPGGSSGGSAGSWRDDGDDGFDADAAIARYKSRQLPVAPTAAAASAVSASRSVPPHAPATFGRRGLTT